MAKLPVWLQLLITKPGFLFQDQLLTCIAGDQEFGSEEPHQCLSKFGQWQMQSVTWNLDSEHPVTGPGICYFYKSLRECDLHSILTAPAVGTYFWLLWRSWDCSHSPCLPGWEWHASPLLTIMGLHWAWCWVWRHRLLITLPGISMGFLPAGVLTSHQKLQKPQTAQLPLNPGSYSQYTAVETWIMNSRPGSILSPQLMRDEGASF